MTPEEDYRKKYPIKISDFLPWGYDAYCARNKIINAECLHGWHRNDNPYLDQIQFRARFLRDFAMPVSVTIATGIGLGITFISAALLSKGVEKTKNLIDKLF